MGFRSYPSPQSHIREEIAVAEEPDEAIPFTVTVSPWISGVIDEGGLAASW